MNYCIENYNLRKISLLMMIISVEKIMHKVQVFSIYIQSTNNKHRYYYHALRKLTMWSQTTKDMGLLVQH